MPPCLRHVSHFQWIEQETVKIAISIFTFSVQIFDENKKQNENNMKVLWWKQNPISNMPLVSSIFPLHPLQKWPLCIRVEDSNKKLHSFIGVNEDWFATGINALKIQLQFTKKLMTYSKVFNNVISWKCLERRLSTLYLNKNRT